LIGESTSPSGADDALDTSAGEKILSPVRMSVEWPAGHHEVLFGHVFDDENIFQNMDLCLESSQAGQLVEGMLRAASAEANSRVPVRWSQIARPAASPATRCEPSRSR
jgi:hypothetical protein